MCERIEDLILIRLDVHIDIHIIKEVKLVLTVIMPVRKIFKFYCPKISTGTTILWS